MKSGWFPNCFFCFDFQIRIFYVESILNVNKTVINAANVFATFKSTLFTKIINIYA